MNLLRALRLLLDVYGALFLAIMLAGAVFQGVFPYQVLMNLGRFGFYLVMVVGLIAWLGIMLMYYRRDRHHKMLHSGDDP